MKTGFQTKIVVGRFTQGSISTKEKNSFDLFFVETAE